MNTGTQYIVYGAGGFGREVAWLIESCSVPGNESRVIAFVDDNPSQHGSLMNDIPVMSFDNARAAYSEARWVVAIAAPRIRQTLTEKLRSHSLALGTIIHPRVEKSRWVSIGESTVICAGNILTTNIVIGPHVHINLDCTVGHDVIMDEYVTLAPGVHISGYVHLQARVYVGTGAVIINGSQEHPLVIGQDAVIGAGACVTKSVTAGVTVVGVPAKPLQKS